MNKIIILISFAFLVLQMPANAGELDIPNSFTAGTPAVAADVNTNFAAVETAVDGNAVDITTLLASVAAMETRLNTLETDNAALTLQVNDLETDNTTLTSQVTAIEANVTSLQTDNANLMTDNSLMQNFITEVIPYLRGGTDRQGNPKVSFRGVNVHIHNNDTNREANGLGNLIMGFDQDANPSGSHREFCSVVGPGSGSSFTNQTECESNAGVWGNDSQKIGSHYIVVGAGHSYTQYGGIVFGSDNVANGQGSSVFGGRFNIASGFYSNVTAGQLNIASGFASSVNGGGNNTASFTYSNVSGGEFNTASGRASSVSGGDNNNASGEWSHVSGGDTNVADGQSSSISGGVQNSASARWGTVGGGSQREAAHEADWAAGTLWENF